MTGIIGFGTATGVGAVYNQFLQDYSKANKTLYPTAGQYVNFHPSVVTCKVFEK
jgi:hypothetical protein